MKIKMIPLFFLSLTSILVAACVAPVDDAREANEPEEIATAVSALVYCGTSGAACPADQHPVTYKLCSSSCTPKCGPGIYNAVLCSPHGTLFQQCGLDCPAGWHSAGPICQTACGACDASTPNAAFCQAD